MVWVCDLDARVSGKNSMNIFHQVISVVTVFESFFIIRHWIVLIFSSGKLGLEVI